MRSIVFSDAQELGEAVARIILERVEQAERAGRRCLLGCPSGRSPVSTYQALGRMAAATEQDLSHLVLVMMDEYVLRTADGFVCCPAHAHYSCHRFAEEQIVPVINAGLPPARRLPPAQVWFPDPSDPAAYDAAIRAAGGLDLFLVATGASDGHVAFNPPGSAADTATRIIPLAESTRRDNMITFPDFTALSDVPCWGVSVGLGTIADLSQEVILLAHGADKREAIARLSACDDFDARWPASIVYRCHNVRVMLDSAAAWSVVL